MRRKWVVIAEVGRAGQPSYWVASKHWTEGAAQRRKQVLRALNSYSDIVLYVMPRRDAEALLGVTR